MAKTLLPQHLKMLQDESAISAAQIKERGYYSATRSDELAALGFSSHQRNVPALVIPQRDVHGQNGSYIIRPDTPRTDRKGKSIKYEVPAGARMKLDVPASVQPLLADPSIPLVITEGSKKVDASLSHGIRCVIGVFGVWNCKGTNEHGGKAALPDWDAIALNGRSVIIAFDSDIARNKGVQDAAERLAAYLGSRGAHVRFLVMPPLRDGRKRGLDDHFAHGGTPDELRSWTVPNLPEMPDDTRAAKRPALIKAAELMTMVFPEPRWAVPGIFAEGANILAGPPKKGKSWLALTTAIAVAAGGSALGKIPVEAGEVLYLALEDTRRRLQERLGIILRGVRAPARLEIATSWPSMDEGGIEEIDAWLTAHPAARLVIIDTLARIRGRIPGNGNLYQLDYAAMGAVKAVADKHSVAIVVIHHTRKSEAEDPLDMVSGTNGIVGAADTILVLKREIGRADGTLYVRGRDVAEADHALSFQPDTCTWLLLGDADAFRTSNERHAILDVLRRAGEPLRPKQIADMLGKKDGAVRKLLHDMANAGQVEGIGGGLWRRPHQSVTDTPGNTGNSGNAAPSVTARPSTGNGGGNARDERFGPSQRRKDESVTGITGVTASAGNARASVTGHHPSGNAQPVTVLTSATIAASNSAPDGGSYRPALDPWLADDYDASSDMEEL